MKKESIASSRQDLGVEEVHAAIYITCIAFVSIRIDGDTHIFSKV